MKIKLLQSIKIIVLGLILTAGLSYGWTGAPGSGNRIPVNTSTNLQYKLGALGLGTVPAGSLPAARLYVSGNTLVNQALVVAANANTANPGLDPTLDGKYVVGVPSYPPLSNPTPPTVKFDSETVLLSTSLVPGAVSGGYKNPTTYTNGVAPLCADQNGVIYVCARTAVSGQ